MRYIHKMKGLRMSSILYLQNVTLILQHRTLWISRLVPLIFEVCAHPWPKCGFLTNDCWICRSCAELLLLLPQHVPGALWEEFQSSMKVSIPRAVKRLSLRLIFAVIGNEKLFSNDNAFGLAHHWTVMKTNELNVSVCRFSLQKHFMLNVNSWMAANSLQ